MDQFDALGVAVVVASFPRSGTHLTIDLLRRHFVETRTWKWPGERTDHLYIPLEGLHAQHDRHDEKAVLSRARRAKRATIKTHAMPGFAALRKSHAHWARWIEDRGSQLYVCRDGREVMASLYAGRAGMIAGSEAATFSEFLRMTFNELPLPRAWSTHVNAWLGVQGVTVIRYHDLIRDTAAQLRRVGEACSLTLDLQQPLLPPPIRSLWHGRLSRLIRMRPASTALVPRGWGGSANPKWRDLFSQADRQWFHEQVGDTLVSQGFVADERWIND